MAKNNVERSTWWSEGPGRFVQLRPRLLITALFLIATGVTARYVWEHLSATLSQSPRYQITAEVIHLSPKPAPKWIRSDIKQEVLRNSDITHTLSLLVKPQRIQQRLVDSFSLHPWVRSVRRIEIAGPSRIEIELEYREPIAVCEVTDQDRADLLPVDRDGFRLPDEDLTETEKSYLPRIAHIEGRPLVGEPWTDKRVVGAVVLADRLRRVWDSYQLMEIVPSPHPEVERSHRFFTYDIRSSSGTLIRWGAAPELGPPNESNFEAKLARLAQYIGEHGPLNSIHTPKTIDVRDGLFIEKRTVKRDEGEEVLR